MTESYHGFITNIIDISFINYISRNTLVDTKTKKITHEDPVTVLEPSCTSHPLPAQEKNIARSADKA